MHFYLHKSGNVDILQCSRLNDSFTHYNTVYLLFICIYFLFKQMYLSTILTGKMQTLAHTKYVLKAPQSYRLFDVKIRDFNFEIL